MKFDVTILTDRRYVAQNYPDTYSQNVVLEDRLLAEALERKGLMVTRTHWDNPDFDWSATRFAIFRTTWDYFDRFDEFEPWLDRVRGLTTLINPTELIYWNIDKFYLRDLEKQGVNLPPTIFIERGETKTLQELLASTTWQEVILKPSVSGAARHTYRFKKEDAADYTSIFHELVSNERMLLQEFQTNILTKGEVAFMVFGGKYSHAVLKKAKAGDFRVQDDFGGTVHPYEANPEEIAFIEKAIAACSPVPLYARVDVIWDNHGALCLGELEMIEPELWFRMNDASADQLAEAIFAIC